MQDVKITASIVSYNGFDDIKICVESLLKHTKQYPIMVYIVDNNSPNGSGEKLQKEYLETENVKVILNKENVGFGSGHNTVLPFVESGYHAVINPDIEVDCDVLGNIVTFMQESPDIAMVTPKLKFPTGEEQFTPKRKPNFMGLFARQVPFKCFEKYDAHYLMQDEDLTKTQDIEFCTGSFFVVKAEVYKKIQGFDPNYFMYVEDADITQKILAEGRAVFYPETYVYHAWNRQARRSLKQYALQMSSMVKYFKKWGFKWGFKI